MSIILWSSHSECASTSMSSAHGGAATLIVPRWLPRSLSVTLSSIYREMTTQVKWDNHLSENIYVAYEVWFLWVDFHKISLSMMVYNVHNTLEFTFRMCKYEYVICTCRCSNAISSIMKSFSINYTIMVLKATCGYYYGICTEKWPPK
jgi:hypothetical protein